MRDRFHDDLMAGRDERAVWGELEGLRESGTVRATRRSVAERRLRRSRRKQRLARWRPALPASALAAAAVAMLVSFVPGPAAETLRTRVGEMRREQLADGTVVLLNTDTRIRVTLRDRTREVNLISGQARFDVAHDAARPFRVTAGALSVTAIGTAFDVVMLPRRTAVTLIAGKVLVRTAGRSGAVAPRPELLTPGQQITIAAGRVTPPHAARLDAALAWQRSYVDLSNMRLNEALDEVNRYSATKIMVEASDLKDEEMGGVFKAGDVDAVSRALCVYFNLKVVRRDSHSITLGRQSHG